MKRIVIAVVVLIALAGAAVSFIAANNAGEALGAAHLEALDPNFIRIVETMPLTDQEEYLVLYESSSGVGTVIFERTALLKRWQTRGHTVLPLEMGISQDYIVFAIDKGQRQGALVYGEFIPAEDYNLPIRLRNIQEQYDEKPRHVETEQGAVIWYQYLTQPSARPDDFELYNEITGTVIARPEE